MMRPGLRAYLFLQGPPGPFFSQLSARLRDAGHRCVRVNFNGGDRRDWRGRGLDFTGSLEEWPAALGKLVEREGITDVVLFGDCRPLHRVAARKAQRSGLAVHVFEEGYIRPDWVTLEPGGVNGYSRLPRDPKTYLRLATDLPPVPVHPPVPSSFMRRAREATAYYFACWRDASRFPGYVTHRPQQLSVEAAGWLRRLLMRPLARLRAACALSRLGPARYFVLPLQLDSDHQIRTHSPFSGMSDAVETVIASFAAHAPPVAKLVVKEHPLDNGLKPWRRTVTNLAQRHGIDHRVVFLEHGDLIALTAGAEGLVTVNSTSGTLALAAGKPVIVLGQAVYDLPGVTDQGGLDDFWSRPTPPQGEIFEAFRRVLAARCLLRGGFSSVEGRRLLTPLAAERLAEPANGAALAAPLRIGAGE